MRLLLDTHIFIWAVAGSPLLKPAARKLMQSADQVYVSAASQRPGGAHAATELTQTIRVSGGEAIASTWTRASQNSLLQVPAPRYPCC